MSGQEFAREWERWNNLLRFARRVNDQGGERRCLAELERLRAFRVR